MLESYEVYVGIVLFFVKYEVIYDWVIKNLFGIVIVVNDLKGVNEFVCFV